MKKIISAILVISMLFALCSASFIVGGATESYDPSNDYTVKTAANEDSDVKMWFQHANVKVFQEDTTSTERDTYSVYMAKNEIQGTQVVLYTDVAKSTLTASCTDFVPMDGDEGMVSASLYYETYIECTNLDVTNVIGVTSAEESIIREGHIPDAIIPIENISKGKGTFSLGAGKTQTLLVRLKTELDTPSGWYRGTFELKDSDGNVIKTADIFAYVWNFEIPEKTTYESSIYIDRGTSLNDTTYKACYDYLLENRLCATNLPGTYSDVLKSTNEYLDNPRVNSIKMVTGNSYLSNVTGDKLKAVYDDLATREDFEELKEKIYFYTADEPRSQQQLEYLNVEHAVIQDAAIKYNSLKDYWPDPYTVVPYDHDFPYPHGYDANLAYNSSTGTYVTEYDGSFSLDGVKDAMQGLMDEGGVTIWCPKMCVYTPDSVANSVGYNGVNKEICAVQTMNGSISGFDCRKSGARYFNWNSVYGSFETRINNYISMWKSAGKNIKLWWYNCGKGPTYTYCNHLIENTGLQTELMFWQSMQVGSNGYLYYASNAYSENGTVYVNGSSSSMDGSMVSDKWRVNRLSKNNASGEAKYVYGNGVLFYGTTERSILKAKGSTVIGTIRVEQMRDGIEDYEMLNLYREYYGEDAMQELISLVSSNVACYLSLPGFDRSRWNSSMTSEDIFAEVRKQLGDAVEQASNTSEGCTHEWDNGVVTTPATYTEKGVKTYTCALCGETYTEEIPVLEALVGDVDGDGLITSKDIKLLRKYIAGSVNAEEIIEVNSDVNGDGIISVKDVKALVSMTVSGN